MQYDFLNFNSFNLDEYEHYEVSFQGYCSFIHVLLTEVIFLFFKEVNDLDVYRIKKKKFRSLSSYP